MGLKVYWVPSTGPVACDLCVSSVTVTGFEPEHWSKPESTMPLTRFSSLSKITQLYRAEAPVRSTRVCICVVFPSSSGLHGSHELTVPFCTVKTISAAEILSVAASGLSTMLKLPSAMAPPDAGENCTLNLLCAPCVCNTYR